MLLTTFCKDDALEKCSLTDYYCAYTVINHCFVLTQCFLDNWEEPGKDGAVAWGCGSLMNHSYDANIQYVKHFDTHDISYVAWRDIHPGDELTMNYNGTTPDDKTPLSKKGYTWDAL